MGVKGGLIPDAASDILTSKGVEATYETIGVNLRYALLKDRLVIPAVSIGASWNYVRGTALAGLGLGVQSISVTAGDDFTISMTDPDVNLEWEANIFDFTLQVSKNLLIFTPYAGAGMSIGSTSVLGGLTAITTIWNDTLGQPATPAEIQAIEDASAVTLNDQGFLVSAEANTPTVRIYGGTSINILILKLDFMASYVPATRALGAQVMARIQL